VEFPLKIPLVLALLLASAPVVAYGDQLVPAGSVINCTVAENKVSSQTEKIGDPIMCTLSHTESYGRSSFPYGSYLIGHFAAYKDPGHFVGKGWMELVFDRLMVQPDTIVPINARVVAAPGYRVDSEGEIHGNGHPVKDTVEWLIPVLWPLDLINLPRRGPRPVLKPESRLTLKVLDDFGIPTPMENAVRTPSIASRQTTDEPTYQDFQRRPLTQDPAPIQQAYAPQPQQPQYQPQQYQPQPAPVQYQPAPAQQQTNIYMQTAAAPPQVQQPVYVQQPRPRVYYYPYGYGPPPPPPPYYYYRGY